ncbi:MAG: O-antigen ligase family protein [Oscillospiraceae bacterium]|nr:O-antigen ligase family protein [Oscillospiraceae bacterium]
MAQKENKTIFNTTEKSNFILNMRESTVRKGTVGVLLVVPVFIYIMVALKMFFIVEMTAFSMTLTLAGAAAFIWLAVVQAKKQQLDKSQVLPFLFCIIMFVLAFIASIWSFDFDTALSGNYGRFEGLLSITCYMGIFLLAMQIQRKRGMRIIMDVLVAAGVFNCVFALLQSIPGPFANKYSFYINLAPMRLLGVYLPSGLCTSPIFFATLLTLVCGVSVFGSCYDLHIPRRVLYTVATVIFIVFAVATHTIIGILGISAVLACVLVFEIIRMTRKKSEHYKTTTYPIVRCVIYIAVFVSCCIMFFSGGGLYDGGIMWTDSFSYLSGVSGYYYPNTEEFPDRAPFDISNFGELYGYLWSNTLEAMDKYDLWLTGAGPDCLYYTQLKTTSEIMVENYSFDKCYNDYLYIAATRGIPSLLAYAALLVLSVKRSLAGVREMLNAKKNDFWVCGAAFAAVLSYIIIGFFNTSSILVAPIFWMLLGFCAKEKPPVD